jgi:hypothetical protein
MERFRLTTDDSKTEYFISKEEDFEYANPIEKISNSHIEVHMGLMKLLPIPPIFSKNIMEKVMYKKALADWEEYYKKMMELQLPGNLSLLLESSSKKEQIKLLKGLSLTSDELSAFIMKSYSEHGYLCSQYTSHFFPNGTNENDLPRLAHIEDGGQLTTIGETTLTEGQVRKLVTERTVKVAKFLDRGDHWHCFFLTYKSMNGQENHKSGQPHLHYISDKWTISRGYVLQQMKSKDYNLPSLPHIDYHRHKNQEN